MDWQEFDRRGIAQELAEVFDQEDPARAVLISAGFPRIRLPAFNTAERFWTAALRELRQGIIANVPEALVNAAADRYPGNTVFSPREQRPAEPLERPDTGTSILVSGSTDVLQLLDRAREIAEEYGVTGPVDLGFVSPENVQLRLPEADAEQAFRIANQLEDDNLTNRTTVVPNEFRDYLLRRLLVEGPDQGRFELGDIPASTSVKDVARVVMSDYQDEGIWPSDKDGKARSVVVDHVDEETGAHTRLDLQQSLHKSGIKDGDTLAMAPESTAGAINPRIRDEALARVRSQVLAYAKEHPSFRVRANAKVAPTEYVFNFKAQGWGPPSATGGVPFPVDEHEILVLLPSDFPMLAPAAYWQTPIFHPNVARKTGKVCLGVLEDRFRPGLPFGEICQTLVDIAGYQNYEVREGYDREAQKWAVSPEGQVAIEERGGRSVTRLHLSQLDDQVRAPLPLRVKRFDA